MIPFALSGQAKGLVHCVPLTRRDNKAHPADGFKWITAKSMETLPEPPPTLTTTLNHGFHYTKCSWWLWIPKTGDPWPFFALDLLSNIPPANVAVWDLCEAVEPATDDILPFTESSACCRFRLTPDRRIFLSITTSITPDPILDPPEFYVPLRPGVTSHHTRLYNNHLLLCFIRPHQRSLEAAE